MSCVGLGLVLFAPRPLCGESTGIAITPGPDGTFEYKDDLSTARFLDDAFLDNLKVDCWQPGGITNAGPHSNRMLTYRFHGKRPVKEMAVRVDQSANGPNLGGTNHLLLSPNGLDWTPVATSGNQKPNAGGWQNEPLTPLAAQASAVLGRTEVWVRLVLNNHSGLKTAVSNRINAIQVKLRLGEPAGVAEDPQAKPRAAWGRLQQKTGWRGIVLDWADPPGHRPLHYYEDADGWLQEPNAWPFFKTDEQNGFVIRRAYLGDGRSPLALSAFIQADDAASPLMARIIVRSDRESSRAMQVLWDGRPLATFDAARYLESDTVFFVEIPGSPGKAPHELRISGTDCGAIAVRQIMVACDATLRWAEKPKPPPAGPIEVLSAYYIPDPEPPAGSQTVEGRPETPGGAVNFNTMQRLYKEHADFGAVQLVLRNAGQVPARVGNVLRLNGKPIEEAYVDFAKSPWDARGVVWYRVRPRLVQPDQCAEVYIRFRRRPEGEAAGIAVAFENAPPLDARVSYSDPELTIDYVTTGRATDTLYVYVRRQGDRSAPKMSELFLDGRPLQEWRLYGRDFPGGVALLTARLPAPLRTHEYHVVGVRAEGTDRPVVAAQFRVLPFVFPRGSIHTPADQCGSMNMNITMWNMIDPGTCERLGLLTTCHEHGLFDVHRRVAYIFGPDEPDAHDNRGGGYEKGLGYHARRLADAGWQELVERFAPTTATWLIMDGTVRPLNWSVYGQVADISCFDPYPVTYYGADHAYVRESLSLARQCGAPRRMYACLEAYGWRSGDGVPKDSRGPVPAEYRQNVIQAIGAGMKGLTSWVHTASAGGWQLNPAVAGEVAKLNALIKHIEADLLLGAPIDLCGSDAGDVMTGTPGREKWPKPRVWTGSLLCGPDTIIVTAVNHIPASTSGPPRIEPARDVTVTVRLPDYLRAIRAFEATEDGLAEFPCTVDGGKAILRVDRIESGRVFVLRARNPSATE